MKKKILIIKNKNGVTLIELVAAIAIIGILASITMISFRNQKIDSQLESAARELAAAIREAQNYALAGKEQNGSIPCDGIHIRSLGSMRDYQIYFREKEAGGGCGSDVALENYDLANGIVISNNFEIIFQIPHGQATVTTGSSPFTMAKGGKNIGVCLSANGRVEETNVTSGTLTCP